MGDITKHSGKPLELLISTGDIDQNGKRLVAKFFTLIEQVYGTAKYRAMWPEASDQRAAMALWARDILAIPEERLADCIVYAKEQLSTDGGEWINMGKILEGRPKTRRMYQQPSDDELMIPRNQPVVMRTTPLSWELPDYDKYPTARPVTEYDAEAFDDAKQRGMEALYNATGDKRWKH